MFLRELEKYNPITIQCHDNPDGDALASAYALYTYFYSQGKTVQIIYGGTYRIQKYNLCLMVDLFQIPIVYLPCSPGKIEGLLLTVDCQYGGGNVSVFEADAIAMIDHHQVECWDIDLSIIRPEMDSCSTLVWKLLVEEKFPLDQKLQTILYYGLYADTNQFGEISNPDDKDMFEDLQVDQQMITKLRNSNLSLQELEIAGATLMRYSYCKEFGYAILQAQPCDSNILGLISDLVQQVHEVHTCVVFHEIDEVIRLSVRSCVPEVKANELVSFLVEGMGSGGGHAEKSGGCIPKRKYHMHHHGVLPEAYFHQRMNRYFESYDVLYAEEQPLDMEEMVLYDKCCVPMGFAEMEAFFPLGTPVTIRTIKGDKERVVEEQRYLILEVGGEVHVATQHEFREQYQIVYVPHPAPEGYRARIKNRLTGVSLEIDTYAGTCVARQKKQIYARKLERSMKVFNKRFGSAYLLGKPGDYLVGDASDLQNIYVVQQDLFPRMYKKITM